MICLHYAVPALQEKVAEKISAAKTNSQPLGFLQQKHQKRVGYMANSLPEKERCAHYLDGTTHFVAYPSQVNIEVVPAASKFPTPSILVEAVAFQLNHSLLLHFDRTCKSGETVSNLMKSSLPLCMQVHFFSSGRHSKRKCAQRCVAVFEQCQFHHSEGCGGGGFTRQVAISPITQHERLIEMAKTISQVYNFRTVPGS